MIGARKVNNDFFKISFMGGSAGLQMQQSSDRLLYQVVTRWKVFSGICQGKLVQ
jgi:hypothetical protein